MHAAWDPRLQRRVALKILSVNDPEEADRFAREARLAAALSHPNPSTRPATRASLGAGLP